MKRDGTSDGAIPNLMVSARGLHVRLPSNYNGETGEYSGEWDGAFKIAWTNSPPWILMDMLTNKKLFPFLQMNITPQMLEPKRFYDRAKWCDERMENGERRFTVDLYLRTVGEARDAALSIAVRLGFEDIAEAIAKG